MAGLKRVNLCCKCCFTIWWENAARQFGGEYFSYILRSRQPEENILRLMECAQNSLSVKCGSGNRRSPHVHVRLGLVNTMWTCTHPHSFVLFTVLRNMFWSKGHKTKEFSYSVCQTELWGFVWQTLRGHSMFQVSSLSNISRYSI